MNGVVLSERMSGPVRPSPFDTPHRVSARFSPFAAIPTAHERAVDALSPRRWSPGDAEEQRLGALVRDVRIIRLCLVALVVIAALTGGVAAGGLIAPTVVALILAIILAPPVSLLERLGLPAGIASILVVGCTVGAIAAGAIAFAPSVSDWTKRAPQIVRTVEHKLRPIKRQLAVVENASRQIAQVGNPAVERATSFVEPPAQDGILAIVATSASHALAKIVYVTALTIFLLALRKRYTAQLILLPRHYPNRLRMARICRDVRERVAGYLLTLAMINTGLAITTGVCFTLAGVSDPLFWGVAYGVLNFVPVIGSTTIIIAALAFGLATASSLGAAIIPALILLALDTVQAYVAQPLLLARRLVVSPIAIFVMVATLVWMWGAPAAIAAVPILILLHTIMKHIPALRPFASLLATTAHRDRRQERQPLVTVFL